MPVLDLTYNQRLLARLLFQFIAHKKLRQVLDEDPNRLNVERISRIKM